MMTLFTVLYASTLIPLLSAVVITRKDGQQNKNHMVCLIAVTFKPCDNDEAGGRPLLVECLTH